MKAFLSGLTIFVLSVLPVYAIEITGSASVVDGDTLEIRGKKIRLHGVDAPEGSQLCL